MRRTDFIYLLFIFIGGCLSPVISHASTFMPIVTNYTAKDYQAGLQNWALAQGKNGEMYIGNNTGLLCFDGYTWSKYQMPGNQLVRSILIDGDRIYVGTYEDFGYFSRNSLGILEYTSLWSQLKNIETHNDEIWNILKIGEPHTITLNICHCIFIKRMDKSMYRWSTVIFIFWKMMNINY